jgi:hypothetical protein
MRELLSMIEMFYSRPWLRWLKHGEKNLIKRETKEGFLDTKKMYFPNSKNFSKLTSLLLLQSNTNPLNTSSILSLSSSSGLPMTRNLLP